MPTRVAVCGAGTVGSAVLKLLAQAGDAYSVSCGTDVNLAKERPFDKNVYTNRFVEALHVKSFAVISAKKISYTVETCTCHHVLDDMFSPQA